MISVSPSWDLYRSFLAVLETGSLSGAATELGLTQPTLARHVEQLEAALDQVLFTRSPRGLAPTETALALAPYARTMEAATAAMARAASAPLGEIAGAVRITASDVIGAEVLPTMLAALRARHPGLVFELDLSNQSADLLRRDADVAVRMVRPKQDGLIARKVGEVMLGLHASPAYLARFGAPASLEDWRAHALIGFDRETAGVRTVREMGLLPLSREMFAYRMDNDIAQLNAIRAGCGIGVCQTALGKRYGLTRLFAERIDIPLETWIVTHEDLREAPRVRAVFDHLVAAMSAYARS